jgi:hypothetical protein
MLPETITTTAGTWTKIQAGSVNDQPTVYRQGTGIYASEMTIKHSRPAIGSTTGVEKHLVQIKVHNLDVSSAPMAEFSTVNFTVMSPVATAASILGDIPAIDALLETIGVISGTDIVKSANMVKILASES